MKNNRKMLLGMFTVGFVILLAACGNSSKESSAPLDNQSQNNLSEKTKDDSSKMDSTENASNTDNTDTNNNDTNKIVDTSNNVPAKEEDASTNNSTASLKENYLKKLNDTKKEMDEIGKNSKDTSTYGMKNEQGKRYDVWDGLLNEVYGVLKKQLTTEEMDKLRTEQQNWIKYKEDTALEASLKYKGGTEEH
ncbi:lysozyme inhibitor LprI family protein [Neobacillus vireti]|uniref:Lysozyme inhibitor LprI-like N-terminal domain-containing protein n=1 Tax=Neobacillus vireti LMG 21834 TaxID=1131730 RepID=A0AB94IMK3_9BACI|nr:lysozyme inhibitor LprI family protein [Neobacillus vireti]ETI68341.1 hypothetical protein BAVI_12749 [Neobacillus vireti LMG 21834]